MIDGDVPMAGEVQAAFVRRTVDQYRETVARSPHAVLQIDYYVPAWEGGGSPLIPRVLVVTGDLWRIQAIEGLLKALTSADAPEAD